MSAWASPPVVIENGSYRTKAGFSCDNHPLSIFRTVVGRPKFLEGSYGRGVAYDVLIGDEAIERCDDYELTEPIVHGEIVQWDNIERMWHHIMYRELKVAPEDRSVFLTCPPRTPMAEKIKCCEVFLELLNVPAVCIQPSASLSMFAYGQATGITVEIGYDTTQVTPVYEGTCIKYANTQTGYAARQAFHYVKDKLEERGIDLGQDPIVAVDTIMRECCYVTQDASVPRFGYKKFADVLGDYLEVSQEVFMAGEMFFQPNLVMQKKSGYLSLQDTVQEALHRCDLELRDELLQNVVLSGGLAMIPGMGKRLEIELCAKMEKTITVSTSNEADIASWTGGAIFAGVEEAYSCLWVTRKQYEDYGDKIIRKRFIP